MNAPRELMLPVVIHDRIERLPISALVPYARNSRTHSDEQLAQIAASMREFGFTNPVLIDEQGGIVAGHGRVMAAQRLGMAHVPCLRLAGLTEAQRRAYVIADNQIAMNAGWDDAMLRLELADLQAADFNLDLLGFDADRLDELLADEMGETEGLTDADEVPEVPEKPATRPGDVWLLGRHRVMCGDSTNPSDVKTLMAGSTAQLMHADPPYGMGKEADGVANDNLYVEKLDQFQMAWWATFRPYLANNASAYIWGNAPDLWRLWFAQGLGSSENSELRNEIVWDKKNVPGMASPGLSQFPMATERCLFFQLGDQFLGNINADDFPATWEPMRAYFEGEAVNAGIKPADIKRVCGCGMYAHWFTRSQFTLMPEKHYRTLAAEYPGRFARPWADLKGEWDCVRGARSYFDNAHAVMRDVWEFSRVTGDERHGHATPKPVEMMERVMKSSLPTGGLCVEPFGGSGSTLMGAEKTGRVCYTMELQPRYVDVIVRRWQDFTGQQATLEATGQTFDEVSPGA
jgi:DNA modification methylase